MGLLHCNRPLREGKLRIIAASRPRELQSRFEICLY
jgi:hypothetical protein